ncbi:MAG: hypothetical protein EPO08_09245 [Rhodospirillaceae bacterium]|nr:MAG: hypothetical protein EPO08_09245 [Rhodospirillaceae bacterium]
MTPPTDSGADPKAIDYAALARRYMDLWQEQAAKLAQDPALMTGLAAAWAKIVPGTPSSPAPGSPSSNSPPSNPPASHAGSPSPGADGPKTAPPSSGDGSVDFSAVLRRLDALELRLAALESAKPSAPTSRSAAKSPRGKPRPAG